MTRSGHAPLRGPRTSRISTRFRHGDTYKRSETLGTVEVAWSANTALHKARSTVHLGLRRFWGGHFARVSAIGRMFWSWLPILPASPVSTRRGPTTHSPNSDLISMYQYILRKRPMWATHDFWETIFSLNQPALAHVSLLHSPKETRLASHQNPYGYSLEPFQSAELSICYGGVLQCRTRSLADLLEGQPAVRGGCH